MNIFLTGYRCTGKTSAGNYLSKMLGWPVVDADVFLVEKYGKSIAEIVASEGWASFRKKEKAVLAHLCALDKHIIATGGGVVLDPDNVDTMKKSGVIIWLRALPETIKRRIVKDQHTDEFRPSLTKKGLLEEIEETLRDRYALYEKAMDFCIDTDEKSIEDICGLIINIIKEKGLYPA